MKIAIYGAGRVGSSIASALLFNYPIKRLEIHDTDYRKALGEVQDLKDLATITELDTLITTKHGEVDLSIITAGLPRRSSREQHNFEDNYAVVRYALSMIDLSNPVIIATNPKEKIKKALDKDPFMRGKKIFVAGFELDNARKKRTGQDPEMVAEFILDNKGYTSHGITAEVIELIQKGTIWKEK